MYLYYVASFSSKKIHSVDLLMTRNVDGSLALEPIEFGACQISFIKRPIVNTMASFATRLRPRHGPMLSRSDATATSE